VTTLHAHEFVGYEHVQIAIPADGERRAREFYVDVLGFVEVVRPESLGGSGGGWFRAGDVNLHLGVGDDFHPTAKGHPAILARDLAPLRARLGAAGVKIEPAAKLPGFDRFHVRDPFGNRLEFMQRD